MRAAPAPRLLRTAGLMLGLAALVLAVGYLIEVAEGAAVGQAVTAVLGEPAGLLLAVTAYAAAFGLRTLAWCRVLPALTAAHAWAALHVALLGNHVLPLRLGEALRVTSVVRRTDLSPAPVAASALVLRSGDLLAVLALAALGAPALLFSPAGALGWVVPAGLALALGGGLWWLCRLRARDAGVRLPDARVVACTLAAWLLEAAVVAQVAQAAGVPVTPLEAVAVTAVTVAAQALAVTPGGFGTYEAAATAALIGAGVPAGPALGVAVVTHVVKTAYSVVLGVVALAVPAPGYWGRWRLPRRLPPRPQPWPAADDAPVVAVVPVHDEAATVAEVVRRLPRRVRGHRVVPIVVDDGSTDGSGALAAEAGAQVVRHQRNLGLGAAVRRALAEATALRPAVVVYLDADLEYDPRELERLAAPILAGGVDYVVGSRFSGDIRRMLPHRRAGNRLLTAWVRWVSRRRNLTDGQSGYRAFSPRAAAEAEIVHDYNYAQVLTLDLLGKGFRYAEVPITYAFRRSGRSFVRLGRYLRQVVPAVHRELNGRGSSVLHDVSRPALAGVVQGRDVEAPAGTDRVDRVAGHDQRVVSVVVGE